MPPIGERTRLSFQLGAVLSVVGFVIWATSRVSNFMHDTQEFQRTVAAADVRFEEAVKENVRNWKEANLAIRAEIVPFQKQLEVFVPRAEFVARMETFAREMVDLKSLTHDTNNKVDGLYQQQRTLQIEAWKRNNP